MPAYAEELAVMCMKCGRYAATFVVFTEDGDMPGCYCKKCADKVVKKLNKKYAEKGPNAKD